MKKIIFLALLFAQMLFSAENSIIFGVEKIDTKSSKILDNVLEGLTAQDIHGNPTPQIAHKWEISEDGKRYLFYLNKNIICHDGSRIDADAVFFSLSRFIDKSHSYYEKEGDFDIISSIKALDSERIEILLKEPYAPFLSFLTEDKTKIYSKASFEKIGLKIKDNPVGSGPFKITEWDGQKRVVLERFDMHHTYKPKVDRIIFKANKSIDDNLLALKSGEINLLELFTQEQQKKALAVEDVKISSHESFTTIYMSLNTQREPFSKKSIREALTHALNKTNLIKYVYGSGFVSADSFLPSGMFAYTNEFKPIAFDQSLASLILEKDMPVNRELKLYFFERAYYSPKLAELIKNQLESVGFRVKIVTPPTWSKFLADVENGEHDLCIFNWSVDNGDPDNFMKLFTIKNAQIPALNDSFFIHDELDSAIQKAKVTNDANKRKELYKKAQQIIHDEAPSIPLTYFRKNLAMKKNIDGIDVLPTTSMKFHNAVVR